LTDNPDSREKFGTGRSATINAGKRGRE